MLRVRVLHETGRYYEGNFAPSTDLWQVLKDLEKASSENFTSVWGVPEPEETELIRIQYNVKGYMQPVMEPFQGNIKVDTKEALAKTTLTDINTTGSSKLQIRLTFKYTPPKVDEKTAQEMIGRLREQLFSETPPTQSNAKPAEAKKPPRSTTTKTKPAEGPKKATEAKPQLPPSRHMKITGLPKRAAKKQVEAKDSSSDSKGQTGDEATDAEYEVGAGDLATLFKGVRGERQQSSKSFKEFETTLIRFRLPGRLSIEARFLPSETIRDVMQFVKGCLSDGSMPFTLFTTPPRYVLGERDKTKTLASLRLVPSAIVHFSSPHVDRIKGGRTAEAKKGGDESPGWYLQKQMLEDSSSA